jgi:hypothetical protein
MPKQSPGFSFHLGAKRERAIRFLVHHRTHPKPKPAKPQQAFSIRLGPMKELALTQLAQNKGIGVEYRNGEEVSGPRTGWRLLIEVALDRYLDREVPGWNAEEVPRAGGSKAGWTGYIHIAIEEYLDQELPGWRA